MVLFDVIDSTNDYVLKNHTVLHDGDVVVALEQRRGRGRMGRSWESPKGGLWFSIVFKPRKILDPNFYTKLVSVSVVNALRDLGVDASIKWPNDVVVRGGKLAGVLTEGIFKGVVPEVVVVGVGVNVLNDVPEHLKGVAVRLADVLEDPPKPLELLKMVIGKLNANRIKYSRSPGALTRVWKRFLDLEEGDEVIVDGKLGYVVDIKPDRLVVDIGGEEREVFTGVEKVRV